MPPASKFNIIREKHLVLVAPLDWGLGHTTRCIPVIRELITLNCHVLIACNSWQKVLLSQEFPDLTYIELRGYELRYSHKRWRTMLKVLTQTPKVLIQINREKRWLKKVLAQYPVKAVISDNRFGLHVPGIPTVFITHQLAVKTGFGNRIDKKAQEINYRYINRFSTCWVPDYQGSSSLAGALSNPVHQPRIPVKYLGGLSRFEPCNQSGSPDELLILLSGPEPQRTLFEKTLLQQLKGYTGKVTLIRGLPQSDTEISVPGTVTVYNHVPAARLNQLVCSAGWVISRSGYTTVMDLVKLHKKCILIPTPGQAEQEYLAQWLKEQQLAYTVTQKDFSLTKDLTAAAGFPFKTVPFTMEDFKAEIRQFVASLNGR